MKSVIIGYGVIGKLHEQILRNMGTLKAICDSNAPIPKDVARYTNYKLMLDEIAPDVVHICTPHFLHAEMIVYCLERGINVLCEKPLCIRREDIDIILEAERNSTAKLGVCHQNRYNPANRFVKEYITGKKVEGGVGQVSWHRDKSYYDSGEWRGHATTEGGGVLINQALHTLDLMQWFCGMPGNLSASLSNLTLQGVIDVEDTATILAKNGGEFTFYASNGNNKDCPVEITLCVSGEWLKIMPDYVVVGKELKYFEREAAALGKSCYGSSHEALVKDFYNCVKTGKKFEIDGKESAKVVNLILASYKSGGKWIDV